LNLDEYVYNKVLKWKVSVMEVNKLSNYGKDIITIQKNLNLPIKSKIKIIKSLLGFVGSLLWHMNPVGFLKFIKKVKFEK
jgi:hypothetical protein